ncbi:MAG: phenylalanine--tRNA ligase subunit beta [Actinomycetes bacterium]
MHAPLSWLRDFADFPDDVDLLRSTLDDLGLVVEGTEIVGEGLGDIIVARIDEITAIEGADKVRRVVVDAGAGPVEIVCGASNFVVGDLVPLAPVGAVLPGGFEISRRKMRGVTSNGMLCSGREIGLGDDHAGLLLLTEIKGAAPGQPITETLGIEADVVFDVAVEGNRPDAWCIAGIARDLAARLGLSFSAPAGDPIMIGDTETGDLASATILDEELCRRLSVAVFQNVVVGPSPEWVASRLTLAGMRPINNVVDASNYVMLELGQPTHPYDLDKVEGRTIRVRRATAGESLVGLDGQERPLGVPGRGLGDKGEDCVICDGLDVVIGIAGVMGGSSTEIDEGSTTVLLEAANFDPIAITRTSRRLALRTEAAARFAKGTDPLVLEAATARFGALLALSCPDLAFAADPIVAPPSAPELAVISVPTDRISGQLGIDFSAHDVAELLEPRGFQVTGGSEGLEVTIPSNRPDIRRTHHGVADVIEEIARTYGYSRLPRRSAAWSEPGVPSARQRLRAELRDAFMGLGADEAWTSSLVGPGDIALLGIDEPEIVVANPLTIDESRLRRSLLPGLLRSVNYNLERRQDDVALFEIGATFVHPEVSPSPTQVRAGSAGGREASVPDEPERAMVLMARDGDDARIAVGVAHAVVAALRLTDVRVRTVVDGNPFTAGLHPTRSANLVDAETGSVLGSVGEVDPTLASTLAPASKGRRLAIVDLDVDALADHSKALRMSPTASVVSRFPSSDFDLAFALADDVPADRLIDVITAAAGPLIERARLFDVYRGAGVVEGSRSLAIRCRVVADDRTLSEDEIAAIRSSMIDAASALGALLR